MCTKCIVIPVAVASCLGLVVAAGALTIRRRRRRAQKLDAGIAKEIQPASGEGEAGEGIAPMAGAAALPADA
jgi:hypothetical protein